MNVIAPRPKKPSPSSRCHYYPYWNHNSIDMKDVEDACLELQQILIQQKEQHSKQQTYYYYEQITRSGNPLVQDSSFIPSSATVIPVPVVEMNRRPRSYSVGDPRNHYSVV